MTQFNPGTPAPRRGGDLGVYTVLLAVSLVVLLVGVLLLVRANMAQTGAGPFDLVS